MNNEAPHKPALRLKTGQPWLPVSFALLWQTREWPEGVFRTFLFIVALADRSNGVLRSAVPVLARQLLNPLQTVLNEIEFLHRVAAISMIQSGEGKEGIEVTVAEPYWPYVREPNGKARGAETQDTYFDEVSEYMGLWPWIDPGAGKRSERQIKVLRDRGVPIEDVKHAILLGCSRKVMQLSKVPDAEKIQSFGYFMELIREAQQIPAGTKYWQHLEHRLRDEMVNQRQGRRE